MADDIKMTEDTPREPDAPCETEVVSKTVRISPQDNMEVEVPSPQNKKPSWKVWKICILNAVKRTCQGDMPEREQK